MAEGVEFESTVGESEEKVKVKLVVENLDIERKCDTEYHIAYTQLLAKGILPRATLEKRMRESEIWTEADEERLNDLQRLLLEAQLKLEAAETHEKGLAVANEMGNLRGECLKLVEVKAAVLSNSCESLADQIRRDAYIAYATRYADSNKPVFKDYDDFLARSDEPVVLAAREQILSIAGQSFQDSLTSLPEVDYVRSVEKKIEDEGEQAQKSTSTATATKKKVAKKKATGRKTTKKTTKKVTKKKPQ
jgi:hypothetical protein